MCSSIDDSIRKGEDVDFTDLLARFTMDTISSCAFGVSAESFKHKVVQQN